MHHPTNAQLDYLDDLAAACGFTDGHTAAQALYGLTIGPDTVARLISGLRARRDSPLLRSGPASLTFKVGASVGHEEFSHCDLFGGTNGPSMLECHYTSTDAKTGEVVPLVRSIAWSTVVDIVWTPLAA